jgi:sodium-dependent phosphate cotransporter
MNRNRLLLILKLIGILACLYLFIVGIGGMGYAFKLFGKGFAEQILETTSSPIVGLFIGILATALVQSSSTTTSIIVGMVAAGAISIEGAIPMVMGANIGTTITNLLVSLGHITRGQEFRRAFAAATVHDVFNWMAVLVMFPMELATGFLAKLSAMLAASFEDVGGLKLGNPLKAATKPTIEMISSLFGDHPIPVLVISVLITFAMLTLIVKILRSLVLARIENFFDAHLFKNAGRAMVFGLLLTVAVQSSSITTSLVIPLAGAGVLRLIQILPYTLGANIGTTITAMLAALSTGRIEAITVAIAHLLFNLIGIGLIWPIPKIRQLPVRAAEMLADLSLRSRWIPILFILAIFFILPLLLILLLR